MEQLHEHYQKSGLLPVAQQRLVRCRCCDDEFPREELLKHDGYCETCDPEADIYTDPDGNLDFGGEHGEG